MLKILARLSDLKAKATASIWLIAGSASVLVVLTCLPGAESVFSPIDRIYRQFLATHDAYSAPDNVSVILIDKKTVQALGIDQCFSQASHAKLLERLQQAASVVIDIVMPCSAQDNADLAAAIKRHGRVVLPVHVSPESVEPDIGVFPDPVLMAGAAGVGQKTIVVGGDHLIQGFLPYVRAPDTQAVLPHVILQAIRVADKKLPFPRIEDYIHDRVSSLGKIKPGVLSLLLPTAFNLKRYSYVDVLDGAVPDSAWQGQIVYIGDGASDRARTFNLSSRADAQALVHGSEASAMMIEALLDGHVLGKPPLWVKIVINACAIGGALLICLWVTGWRMYALMTLWLATYIAVNAVMLLREAYWLPPSAVMAACCGVFALGGWRRVGRMNASLAKTYRQFQQQSLPAAAKGMVGAQVASRAAFSSTLRPVRGHSIEHVMKHIRGWQSGYIDMMQTLPYAVFVEEHGELVMCNARGRTLLDALGMADTLCGLPDHPILSVVREAIIEAKASGQMRSFELAVHARTHTIMVTPFSDGERYDSDASMTCVLDIHDMRAAIENDQVTLRHMVHDMRSPLATVLSLLEDRLQANVRADAGLFTDIHKLVDYSLRVAQDFTNLARAGHLDHQAFVPVAVNDVVAEAVDQLWHTAKAKNIGVQAPSTEGEAFEASEVHINGHRDMLLRAVVNLLDNAIKYSSDGTQVHIGVAVDAGWVTIAVQDQGTGVPQSVQSRLFEPFFQVASPERGVNCGAGLGLPFVMTVARQHGGTVDLTSSLGAGSCFILKLPLCRSGVSGELPHVSSV